MTLVGGRAVHPVNVKVGGFYRFPTAAELRALRPQLERALRRRARDRDAGRPASTSPTSSRTYEYVSLRTDDDYPIEAGSFVTSSGQRVRGRRDFGDWVTEEHVRALQRAARPPAGRRPVRRRTARPLLAQPRPAPARRPGRRPTRRGWAPTCRNPFRSIVVRAVELVVACEEALRIIDGWSDGGVAVGAGAAARRGRPRRDRGTARRALPPLRARRRTAPSSTPQIVPPTSQNQASIEADLRALRAGPAGPRRPTS